MRGDLPSISSAVLCSPLGLAALHSHRQQHQGHHTHTIQRRQGRGSSIQTNTHTHKFLFSLSLLCLAVSHRLTPVWFYLCFHFLTNSLFHTHINAVSLHSSIHSLLCSLWCRCSSSQGQSHAVSWVKKFVLLLTGPSLSHPPWGRWIRLYEQEVRAHIIS